MSVLDAYFASALALDKHVQRLLQQQQENGMSASQSSEQGTGLPTSLVYRMSCEHFSRPLLEQQVWT